MMDSTRGAALVTGAGARLGKAMALALAHDGWPVAVHYRTSATGAEAVRDTIIANGGQAVCVQADLAVEADTAALIGAGQTAIGRPISVLINSASMFEWDTATTHTRDQWDMHFEANLRAPIKLAQDMKNALPDSVQGLVVNLIDQRVLKPNPQYFTYSLTKAALWSATRTMAQGFAPNIRVNAIAPGPTLGSIHQTEDVFADEQKHTLTGRGGDPDEIVAALRYLVAAHSVTGQMLVTDGGQHLMWKTADIPDLNDLGQPNAE